MVHRFGRTQHQTLIRHLYHLRQTDSVDDYILEFSALMDQLSAYEPNSDMMHYTTHFIDGLKHAARVIVAVQRPLDLDIAYCIASVQEEVGEGDTALNSSGYSR